VSLAPGITYAFRRPRIVAILPAFNEEDVIGSVIQHYLDDGVEVYLIDNCSTDGTAEIARQWLGNGVIRIERFPDDVGGTERAKKEYMWGEILRRNEVLAAELGADWYIRADADEFRVGPWPGMSHAEALTLVDALGFSAVQSQVLEFRPTDGGFPAGGDPRDHIHHYEPAEFANTLWVKAWKQPPVGVPVEIARTGGHAASSPAAVSAPSTSSRCITRSARPSMRSERSSRSGWSATPPKSATWAGTTTGTTSPPRPPTSYGTPPT